MLRRGEGGEKRTDPRSPPWQNVHDDVQTDIVDKEDAR